MVARNRDDYESVIDAEIAAEYAPDSGETQEPCPKCGAKKKWRRGPFQKFLGCAKFPKCDWVSFKKEEN